MSRQFATCRDIFRQVYDKSPSETNCVLMNNDSKVIAFEKLRNSRVIPWKSPSFPPKTLRVQNRLKVTENKKTFSRKLFQNNFVSGYDKIRHFLHVTQNMCIRVVRKRHDNLQQMCYKLRQLMTFSVPASFLISPAWEILPAWEVAGVSRGNRTRNSERKMTLWEGSERASKKPLKTSENLWKPLKTSENLKNLWAPLRTLPLRDPLRGRFPFQNLSVLLPLIVLPLNLSPKKARLWQSRRRKSRSVPEGGADFPAASFRAWKWPNLGIVKLVFAR